MKKAVMFLAVFVVLGITAAVAQTFKVEGKVVNEKNKPVSGANVIIEHTYYSTITDRDGHFALKVKKGTYTLVVGHISYQTYKQEITVDEDLSLEIKLTPKTFITDEVVVSAEKASKEIPLPKTNIPKKKIEQLNTGQDMPFILDMLPSVTTTTDAGNGVGYTGIRIRGIDTRGINVTINGIPLNDAESQGVWWVDLPDLAANTENIQVQRGVGTSTNGAGAFGSTINIQTTATSPKPYAQGSFNYGSFNTRRGNVKAGTGIIDSTFAFDISMSKINSDGFIDRAKSDLKSLAFTGTYYGNNSMLKFVMLTGKEKTYQSWWGVPKEAIDTGNYTVNHYIYDNATDNYQQDHYQLHYTKKISDELSLNAAAFYIYGRGYYENYEGAYLPSYFKKPVVSPNEPDTIITSTDTIINYPDTITDGHIVWQKWLDNDYYGVTYSLKYDNNYVNVIVGGASSIYDGRHFGKVIWADYFGNNYINTDTLVKTDAEWYRGEGIKKDNNVFAKINWFVNEKTNVYVDLQARFINYSLKGVTEDSLSYDTVYNYLFINPKAGISFHPSDRLNFYGFFGISHREPMRSDYIDHMYANQEMKPEKLYDLELGVNYKNKRVRANTNFYLMYYKDQLIATGELNNVGTPIRINVPESYRSGVEFEISGKPTDKLETAANISLSNNRILSSFVRYYDAYDTNWNWIGQKADTITEGVLPFSPSVVAGAYVGYEIIKGLRFAVIGKYTSKQYMDNSGDEKRTITAYFKSTLKLSYDFAPAHFKQISMFISLNNLFHETPFLTNGWVYPYYFGNNLENMIAYYPEANRYFMAGLTIKF